jgi:hypothetical protein
MHDKKKEILVKEGVNHPDIGEENLGKEALERLTGWIHNSHFTDNKLNDKCINDVTVDIGENKDWSIKYYLEDCHITIEGDKYWRQSQNSIMMIKIFTKGKERLKY